MRQPNRDGVPAEDGYGQSFNVQDLQLRRVFELKQRLQELKPELFTDGVNAVKAKKAADASIAKVQGWVHALLGGDAVSDMMKVFEEFAAAETAVKPKRK